MDTLDQETKRKYVAPTVVAVTVRAERGYAASGEGTIDKMATKFNLEIEQQRGYVEPGQWGANQSIAGYTPSEGTEFPNDHGLAAGYFTYSGTDDWF